MKYIEHLPFDIGSNIIFSPDGKYLASEKYIYNFENREFTNSHDERILGFLHDNTYMTYSVNSISDKKINFRATYWKDGNDKESIPVEIL